MTAPLASRAPLLTLTLTALALVIYVAAPETSSRFDALVLDRDQARWWPWLSAHLLHTDPAHLGWNLFAFVCLGTLAETANRTRYAVSIVVGIIAVDVWFAWADTGLRYYCGFSGALNTVLLATLYCLRGSIGARWLIAFAVAVALKIAWEWHSGAALFTHTLWPPAAGAHIAGFVAGMMLVGIYAWRDRSARL